MPNNDAQRLLKHFVEEDAVLRAYVHVATRSHADTQDLLQNIWETLWVKIEQYDDARPFRHWAFGVARLEVLKWRQAKGRSREYLSESSLDLLAGTAVERADELDLRGEFLQQCMRDLSVLWRKVLSLKYYRELSIRDIAGQLGKSTSAVEMILVRSRRALRDCIERKTRQEVPGA